MSFFLFKSILSSIFFLSGLIAVICMFILMGRAEKKMSPKLLRKMHKGAGFTFTILLLVISYFCLKYVAKIGDAMSLRAALHSIFALALFILLILKISIVRFYKQFLRFVPQMGMIVFILAFVVFSTSGGYYFLRVNSGGSSTEVISTSVGVSLEEKVNGGSRLFKNKCSGCHYTDREDNKTGPGLKNILKRETLPFSKKLATVENIRKQLVNPALTMPSFASLKEQELTYLIAYLKTL